MADKPKINALTAKVYKDIVVDDVETVEQISAIAAERIYDKFSLDFRLEPKYLTVFFFIVWNTMMNEIKKKQVDYSTYELEVCGRFAVGFQDRLDSDDEKQGNFVPVIKHIAVGGDEEFSDDAESIQQKFVQFNTENIVNDVTFIKNIASKARKRLNENAKIIIGTDEAIFPILVTVYDAIVATMKLKRKELKTWKYSINFASCFDITVMETEDPLADKVVIKPSIYDKLNMKSDKAHEDLE